MRHSFSVAVGPTSFRIGSTWRAPIDQLRALYDWYPRADDADYTVTLTPTSAWRRCLRPSVALGGDFMLPEAAPLPLAHALLAAEMGMNLQLALGERRFLLLHAGVVERGGRALILSGESGAGKSTLAAQLGDGDWRFMADEFALVAPESGAVHPFPRPVSLKNASIALFPDKRIGPELAGTPKGTIRHLRPRAEAIARMKEPAAPALIVFPRHGFDANVRPVAPSEAFVRLTQASTNYVALGERGFAALARLVTEVPAVAVDYPDGEAARMLIDQLWAGL